MPFHSKKNTQQLGVKKNFFNMIRAIYENSTANILLSGERMKVFALRSKTR